MKKVALMTLLLLLSLTMKAANEVTGVRKLNPTTVEIYLSNNRTLTFDFYGNNIFRLFQDNSGGIIRDPLAKPDAKILVNNPRRNLSRLDVSDRDAQISISTGSIEILIDKASSLFKVINSKTGATTIEELAPVEFEKGKTVITLKENANEYFFGGGVQNGRFSHKGKKVAIENQNSWTDGGVCSPAPFYWSTGGYAVMCYTFSKGNYDFGATTKGKVTLTHETNYLDAFFMVNDGAVALLNDYYQLTGNPVLLPKFAFYEGHLNAYNRDYWKQDDKGILFEDGKRYKESQKDNGGIKESLNGEKNNYQFSARAVIDRYKQHDMPLGWILPNDGYGAGYGQTETLDGNIANLKSFGEYARKNGVEIGLWTQSDLHPKAGISALLQRDIVKEVRDAGVRVLKTDVAWVGDGYSFGLNGVADVAHIMPYYGNNARPFIISLDGWAGTQRYAGVWSGDQTGGEWEYIRFHIPTYIGSGLSGIPNITSDMDGIFGGKNLVMNTRDFQWKTFTPMQLNMDGWGANEKYPHALGEPATSINRNYLKLKSELLPYTYSIARQAVDGLPIIRAMFLQQPNKYTLGKSTEYQYMYGPSLLVAPIYQETKVDKDGNDIRNGIYLPEGRWIDYFSGETFEGNTILNNYAAPLWKLPLFVKAGAIIPMANANNHVGEIKKDHRIYEVYPSGKTNFTEYDDDGVSEAYLLGKGATTLIEQQATGKQAVVTIYPTKGEFDGQLKSKSTEVRINVTARPQSVTATIGKAKVTLAAAQSKADFESRQNVYFYDAAPNLNQFATPGSEFAKTVITKNPMVLVKLAPTDITKNTVRVTVNGYVFAPANQQKLTTGALTAPTGVKVADEAYSLTPSWDKVANADYYEILFEDNTYTTIKDNSLLFDGLTPLTKYAFKIRAVNKSGVSDWTSVEATTKTNPLEFAIHGIRGEVTCADQEGFEVSHLFDFAESGDIWHTKYRANAIPFDMTIDLRSTNTISRFDYLPRPDAGNGTLLKGTVSYSADKINWTDAGAFNWAADGTTKSFEFKNHPTVRYIKLSVTEGRNNYGSGRELYVFKVPGTATSYPGDVNNDGKIDINDLTSYTNYTGLRKGDPDFDGYISGGDINHNGLIDAYDISVVATQLEDGVNTENAQKVGGSITISADKESYKKDEEVRITVKGTDLSGVNALSFALPYDQQDYEFVGIELLNMKEMMNMTYDRLHKTGDKVLYPTFVNVGDKPVLEGTSDLFIIKMKAKKKVKFELKAGNMLLVDKMLNSKE